MKDYNEVILTGEVISGYKYIYSTNIDSYYIMTVKSTRVSGKVDYIPVMISGELIFRRKLKGQFVKIEGYYSSFNKKNRLYQYVRVQKIETENERYVDINSIRIKGTINQQPKFRKTPLTNIDITDLFLRVNEPDISYFPAIAWGRYASISSGFQIGDSVELHGRIQSREYYKKIDQESGFKRRICEISIIHIEKSNQ